jgi:hypothetical protein
MDHSIRRYLSLIRKLHLIPVMKTSAYFKVEVNLPNQLEHRFKTNAKSELLAPPVESSIFSTIIINFYT